MGTMSKRRVGSQPRYEKEHGTKHCRENRLCVECGAGLTGRRYRWCSDDCVTAYQIRAHPGTARHYVRDRDKEICADCGLDCRALKRAVNRATTLAWQDWWLREGAAAYEKAQRVTSPNWRWHHSSLSPTKAPRWRVVRGGHWMSTIDRLGMGVVERARRAALRPHGLERYWWRKSFWDMDHVVAVSEGGGDCDLRNLQTLCLLCHRKRTTRQAQRRARRGARRIPRLPGESRTDYRKRVLES